jgi:hypothetical protein
MPGIPQFGTAEYASDSQTCLACKQPLAGTYYQVNGSAACERCTQQFKKQFATDSHSAFVRAIVFGTGGAVVGLILYSAFTILTGIIIGYVSLAVGWLVGTAIKKGSGGVGGRRYQIAAVALTYAAVSLSAIPIGISYYLKNQTPHAPAATSAAPATDSSSGERTASDEARTASAPAPKSAAAVFGALLFAGLASPFLELQGGVSGIIGLVILFVGIRIAWKITQAPPVDIRGPFDTRAPLPSV